MSFAIYGSTGPISIFIHKRNEVDRRTGEVYIYNREVYTYTANTLPIFFLRG